MATTRERTAKRALKVLGQERFLAFLQAIRQDSDCLAVRLASEEIDEGRTVESLLFTADDFEYSLEVAILDGGRFRIAFGCQPGPEVGDGGEWEVSFRGDGTVESVTPEGLWTS